ncbi:type VI secretion system baseplate subunit TssF [Ruegeria marina]|uniref:Type VI secretion system protein ImpG n=1 Tax=Ruegeria marina TaxID=639004 RepID=A0A1G7CWE5_9RHOB|nr:type VI secretion system baseplate subunit TssF [Ruegeria marina]SDE43774.1 type VI secretion system protein ImpG [Ruegeria marina]
MDQTFLEYYEEELIQLRALAQEFSALHPNVARNLSLDSVPCTDPYVERLLEGVAFLAARTRLKVDGEASRYVRNLLDMLYPDLAGPGPAMSMAQLKPGPQVESMTGGHLVRRGTRLVAGLKQGLSTRAVYTTAQDVQLWPIKLKTATYLQDVGALTEAGVPERLVRDAAAGIRLVLGRAGPGALADLSLDQIDLHFGMASRGSMLFDAIFGFGAAVLSRPARQGAAFEHCAPPAMVGLSDNQALLPRVRPAFEGYRLLREYFLMPERFLGVTLAGLSTSVRAAGDADLELILLLRQPFDNLRDLGADDFRLFVAPLVNLFEHECNLVGLDRHRSGHIVHADRTRPRDFEIYRLLRVENADVNGPEAVVPPLFSFEDKADSGFVYTTDRRPRRPGEDELRRGQTRTSYTGDDLFISVARPAGAKPGGAPPSRLDIRALCTNRDLPILDDTPVLTLETGDPVGGVNLLQPFRRPRPSLRSARPGGPGGEERMNDLIWRWIAQLSLGFVSLAEDNAGAEPLRAMVALYADRGDPALARHGRSIAGLGSRPLIERLQVPGPICFGNGTEITLDVDESQLSGGSALLLSALLAQVFTRAAATNSFVRTKTRLMQQQLEVTWPMKPGGRVLI